MTVILRFLPAFFLMQFLPSFVVCLYRKSKISFHFFVGSIRFYLKIFIYKFTHSCIDSSLFGQTVRLIASASIYVKWKQFATS